jgi:hypothetical protein
MEDRFWGRVVKTDACWLWNGYSKNGRYGHLKAFGAVRPAHVVSYMIHNNTEEPPELEVCHSCDNTLCVNPEHLFLATHKENMRDMIAKGRSTLLRTGRAKGQKDVKQRTRKYWKRPNEESA